MTNPLPARSVNVEVRGSFTAEMDRLRREYSDRAWPGGVSADEFDRVSVHMTATVDGQAAGMVRITHRPPSVLSSWAVDPHCLPAGDDTAEVTRGVVGLEWRGMGLYKLLMAEATRYCHHVRVTRVVGAIEPDFPLRGYLEEIGFRPIAPPTWFHNPPNGLTRCQIILQEPALALQDASAALAVCVAKLGDQGFSVHPSVRDAVACGSGAVPNQMLHWTAASIVASRAGVAEGRATEVVVRRLWQSGTSDF